MAAIAPAQISPACPVTLPAILALLPAANDHRACHWAALADGALIGAGALLWQGLHDPPGFAATLFVRPAWRRRGIGTQLINAMAAAAVGETDGIWSAQRHPDGSAAAGFLANAGFAPAQRELTFRMPADAVLAHLGPVVDRLRNHGRLPASLAAVCLRNAPLDHVAMLVADTFGQPPAGVRQRLQQAASDATAADLDPDISTVLINDGRVIGVVLASIAGPVAMVDCNIVAPSHRRSWANALQLHIATSRARPRAAWIEFRCDEAVRDSVNMAMRTGGTLLASAARYWRAV